MTQFNLLPESILYKRRRRNLIIILSCVQVFIIAVIAASFFLLDHASSYVFTRSELLTSLISDTRYEEAGQLAEELSRLQEIAAAKDYLLSRTSPELVNGQWLTVVNETVPEGVELTSFEITSGRLFIYCQAADLMLAEGHRSRMLDMGMTPVFGEVTLENGLYSYSIYVIV
jgi:hypothetical protein